MRIRSLSKLLQPSPWRYHRFDQSKSRSFFLGIEEYLAWCGQLSKDSSYWRSIKLLTRANDLGSAKRSNDQGDTSMVEQWLDLLKINQIVMAATEEAISFYIS